ncbi:MAG TPA: adenosylmethionine--8-amino-7-oxononanoate transaminase [Xanthobacteraceae bacterium]|nr:adenosylmethionine--8-amino-7-oxononanoate transaminase [Xanthobacteraceae bacterium]
MSGNTSKNSQFGENAAPDWLHAGLDHAWLPYTQMKTASPPFAVVATRGSRIVLTDGRELIDGIASWWTACHGYNHPHIRAAVERQLKTMPHVMFGGLVHEQALTLAQRLAELAAPADLGRVFFSESGSVAVEVALKMAVQYWRNRGVPERTRIVSFTGGYHGDTTGAMAVSDPDGSMHAAFRGLLPQQITLDLPTEEASERAFAALLAQRAGEIAAIIVEPLVQGAGGMRFHAPQVLRTLRDAADRYDILLIFDEIFTGFGRTGALFAFQSAGVVPDILTVGKALTGGTLPLAATLASQKVFQAFWSDDPAHALMHGPTFMANALACAAANASIDLFAREPRLEQVAKISGVLSRDLAGCRGAPGVKDVRVLGAIGVVELDRIDDLNALRQRFVKEGVFIRPFGSVVYLTPAFTIEPDELAKLTAVVNRVIAELGQG